MEATGGIEPPNKGFANLRLNHLATSPQTLLNFISAACCAAPSMLDGAESGIRTHTLFRALRPQRSLSTNFSIPAP